MAFNDVNTKKSTDSGVRQMKSYFKERDLQTTNLINNCNNAKTHISDYTWTGYYIVILKYHIIKQSLSFDTGGYGSDEACDMILSDPNNFIPSSSKDNSCIRKQRLVYLHWTFVTSTCIIDVTLMFCYL